MSFIICSPLFARARHLAYGHSTAKPLPSADLAVVSGLTTTNVDRKAMTTAGRLCDIARPLLLPATSPVLLKGYVRLSHRDDNASDSMFT